MLVLCVVTFLASLLLLVAAFKLPRRKHADGRPEKQRNFLVRRYTLLFEAIALFLCALILVSSLLGVSFTILEWPFFVVVLSVPIAPMLTSFIFPGMIGGPD